MQTDGNLVITDKAGAVTWNSGTFGTAAHFAAFQPDAAWIYFSLGITSALLTGLQMFRTEMSRDAFRVLADVALLTPLMWLPFVA